MKTHLAGGCFEYGHYFIQRCALCGHALIKADLRNIAVPEGQDPRPSHWNPGDLVQHEGNRMSVVGSLECDFKAEDLPPDFCLWELDLASQD